MLTQFWQDLVALISAIQNHSVSAIVIAAIAIVTLFSSQVGSVLSAIWSVLSGIFGS